MDIKIHFSYLSKLLKQKNIYILTNLMKGFMDFQKTINFISKFVS